MPRRALPSFTIKYIYSAAFPVPAYNSFWKGIFYHFFLCQCIAMRLKTLKNGDAWKGHCVFVFYFSLGKASIKATQGWESESAPCPIKTRKSAMNKRRFLIGAKKARGRSYKKSYPIRMVMWTLKMKRFVSIANWVWIDNFKNSLYM